MVRKKNEAILNYKTRQFLIYQNMVGDWCFSYDDLADISTGSKELQVALNIAYESIDERVNSKPMVTKIRQVLPPKIEKKPKKATTTKLQAL